MLVWLRLTGAESKSWVKDGYTRGGLGFRCFAHDTP